MFKKLSTWLTGYPKTGVRDTNPDTSYQISGVKFETKAEYTDIRNDRSCTRQARYLNSEDCKVNITFKDTESIPPDSQLTFPAQYHGQSGQIILWEVSGSFGDVDQAEMAILSNNVNEYGEWVPDRGKRVILKRSDIEEFSDPGLTKFGNTVLVKPAIKFEISSGTRPIPCGNDELAVGTYNITVDGCELGSSTGGFHCSTIENNMGRKRFEGSTTLQSVTPDKMQLFGFKNIDGNYHLRADVDPVKADIQVFGPGPGCGCRVMTFPNASSKPLTNYSISKDSPVRIPFVFTCDEMYFADDMSMIECKTEPIKLRQEVPF